MNKRTFLLALITSILLGSPRNSAGQGPYTRQAWQEMAVKMPDEWYGSDESLAVAGNVLLYQRDIGGWPKNIAIHKPLSDPEKAQIRDEKRQNDAIFDNSATTTEMKFLARMYNKTGSREYKDSFNRGLKFILDAQYKNGGWPMYYPPRKGYYTHITFNDNAIVNILGMLKDIVEDKDLYSSVTEPKLAARSKKAYKKGIDIILKTQIIVNGKPTVWCAQHDNKTLLPVMARSYELPSFSGLESAEIVKLLMKIKNPSSAIQASVTGAIEWFGAHKLKNTRWDYFTNSQGEKDRRIVQDPGAGDLWARFYDLETGEPFVCDRDGIKKRSLEEISYERRNNYSWYTDEPQEVIDKYPEWKAKWIK